jgi:hypothetical protein
MNLAVYKGSRLENLRLHRTKCSMLIKNVIAPALLKEIVNSIGNSGYSLIVDESTDVSVIKYMAICAKYFDKGSARILTHFLGIVQIERATADDLFDVWKNYLQEINLPIKHMIAISIIFCTQNLKKKSLI